MLNITGIKIQRSIGEGHLLATATITIAGCFVVEGIELIEGMAGPYVNLPASCKATMACRNELARVITEEYQKGTQAPAPAPGPRFMTNREIAHRAVRQAGIEITSQSRLA